MSGPLVVLVGPMGVGKSTVGHLLAERLGVAYRDTDEDIVAEQGRTIAEIFADDGECAFRAIDGPVAGGQQDRVDFFPRPVPPGHLGAVDGGEQ
ncbi:shikimate kinase, partial [Streptomyces albogriseolus]|uniref:shikimate kinase n=1 Tax=Streptomyces albogriseolus TaxID=1887 RepID=UPI003460EF6B